MPDDDMRSWERSALYVDLAAVRHNMTVLRRIVGASCKLCPVVKANAYGLGVGRIARAIADRSEMFAVFSVDDAVELLESKITHPLLLLMRLGELPPDVDWQRLFLRRQVHLVVHDAEHLAHLSALAGRLATRIPVHLEVDTGMSRSGCDSTEATLVLKSISNSRTLSLAGVFTHFAEAEADDEFTMHQLANLHKLREDCKQLIPADCLFHAANTFGMLRHPRFHLSIVRVGLAWAGYGPEWMAGPDLVAGADDLRPAITWKSRILQLKQLDPGMTVGYGRSWTAQSPSVIALVPVGYADGYPIGAGSTDESPSAASVRIEYEVGSRKHHAFCPVVGQVNMDQISLDVTEVCAQARAQGGKIAPGCPVELISPGPDLPTHLPTLARTANTFPHEMICRINPRIRRVYTVRAGPRLRRERTRPVIVEEPV